MYELWETEIGWNVIVIGVLPGNIYRVIIPNGNIILLPKSDFIKKNENG